MKKLDILGKVLQSGIVAIVRTDDAEKAKRLWMQSVLAVSRSSK